MSRKRIKQYLMLLTVVGLIAVAANGSGTFASFSAETTNADNTFATGTLFLHNTANGGTTCTSESSSTNDNFQASGCGTLFNLKSIAPGTTATAGLALTNAGTIDASDISVYSPNPCVATIQTIGTLDATITASSTPGSFTIDGLTQTLVANTVIEMKDSNNAEQDFTVVNTVSSSAPSGTLVTVTGSAGGDDIPAGAAISLKTTFATGTPSACSVAQVTIQEITNSSYNSPVNAGNECAYPNLASACSFPSTETLDGFPTTAASATALRLVNGGGDGSNGTGLAANGGTRYFLISVQIPNSGDQNNLQNQQATLDLTWHIDQA